MRRIILLATAAAVLAIPAVAYGGGAPHFIKHATASSLDGANLVCGFKEAGLASGAVETVQCAAQAVAVYECLNNGGNHPQAANKETVNGDVAGTGTFTADQNGNIDGSVEAAPPGPGAFSCPSGQTLLLASVAYTNVVVTDLTSGATLALADQSYTNPGAVF